MSYPALLAGSLILFSTAGKAVAEQAPPPDATPPVLCLEAGGPTATVTALAFDPKGQTLYAAGFDKVVRVWKLDEKNRRFVPEPFAYRVPIGPGTTGVINTMAVSPDGRWVAASGLGMFQQASNFQETGKVFPTQVVQTPALLREQATIYLFDTEDQAHPVRVLQGHEGVVQKLVFAPDQPGKPTLLVSAAQEPGSKPNTWIGKVRLWDVSQAAQLDDKGKLVGGNATLAQWTLAEEPRKPVGLAIRHIGREVKKVRVAIAWNDGLLRVWEPGSEDMRETASVENGFPGGNSTAVFLPDHGLLTGAVSKSEGGYLQVWDDREGHKPQLRSRISLQNPDEHTPRIPGALCLFSGRGNQQLDRAAVIVRQVRAGGGMDHYDLYAMNRTNQEIVARVPLWDLPNAESRDQHLAAAPAGKFLAVAGDGSHRIRVFSIPELLNAREAHLQDIRSVGAVIRAVAFVEKGKGPEKGLVLSETADPAQLREMGERVLVFDFAKRTLTPNPRQQEWKISTPDLDGWEVSRPLSERSERGGQARWLVDWKGPATKGRVAFDLPDTQTVTGAALVPPKFSKVPLLAIASWDRVLGQPMLALYDTATNAQVRQFKGHSQRIHALTASRDGQYLATAAEDETVCLWTLTDLDGILGQHGTLPGITLKTGDKTPLVDAVAQDSPAGKVLKPEDALVGLVPKKGAQPIALASVLDFYDTLWNQKPGAEVSLQIDRAGARRDVPIKVAQGADEQKPLLFLFVTAKREWIAWTPIGPYDSSGREVERYLGWHFNPRKFGAPALFEGAAAQRGKLQERSLLKHLLVFGDIHKAIKAIQEEKNRNTPPLPKPGLSFEVESAGKVLVQQDKDGHILVRQPKVSLRVGVDGASLAGDQVESLTWKLLAPGEQAHEFGRNIATGQRVAAAIDLPGKPAIHRIEIQLRTREANPQRATEVVTVRYQPPPPRIEFDSAWLQKHFKKDGLRWGVVTAPNIDVRARIRLGAPAQQVEIGLEVNKKPVPVSLEREEDQSFRLSAPIVLQLGQNTIVLTARDKEGLRGYEQFETDRQTLVLVLVKTKTPDIVLKAVLPEGRAANPTDIKVGEPVVVSTSTVRVLGTVLSPEKERLELVEIQNASGGLVKKLKAGLETVDFDEALELKPGPQEFRFVAKTANSDRAEARLTIEYQPPLPNLALTYPSQNLALTEGKETPLGQDHPEIEFKGLLTQIDSFHPFQVTIEVNAKEREIRFEKPPAGQEDEPLSLGKFALQPGDNRIRLKVKNRWHEGTPSDGHVFYRRPPSIVGLREKDGRGQQPTIDLIAEVVSPDDLPLTQVELDLNGQRSEWKEYASKKLKQENGRTTWEVEIRGVPLTKGANTIALAVANSDGRCLKTKSLAAIFTPAAEKPVVQIENKPQGPVKDPSVTLRFLVRSATDTLTRLELRKEQKVLQSFDLSKIEKTAAGVFEWRGAVAVDPFLMPGLNSFEVVAANAGGPASDEVVVNYLPPPVRLVVARPKPEITTPTLTLQGHIDFQDARDAARGADQAPKIRVYVNDFLQRPPTIQPRREGTRIEFSARVVFNRPTNKIVIECPPELVEGDRKQEFTVACRHPQKPATLHLLVVGVNASKEDREKLAAHALKALQADADKNGLRSPIFDRVKMHPDNPGQEIQILSPLVTTGKVRHGLDSIRRFIDIEKQGSPNDVVLIYWLGPDLVSQKGSERLFLPTSETNPELPISETGMPLRELLGGADMPGARVLLLDAGAPHLPGDPLAMRTTHTAVLRYPWSKSQIPVPGLLLALEDAVSTGQGGALLDIVRMANNQNFRKAHPESLKVDHNLEQLSGLAELEVSKKKE